MLRPCIIIGYIDSYGSIHHRAVPMSAMGVVTHDNLWPSQTHKRWRFSIERWSVENSCLSDENLTEAEIQDVTATIRKHYDPPLWVIQGEEWEALGRPRSGTAYEEHCKKWEEIYRKKGLDF